MVGAGGGGITSALLAAMRGEEVTLVESHSALGGCASYFKRGAFVFDAGATTLSGVGINEPLGDLFELLGHSPELFPADPGITFHLSSGKTLRYYRDFEKWMEELNLHFPALAHRPFWTLVKKISKKSWCLLRDIKTFPFQKATEILDALKHPGYLSLTPYLLYSTEQALKKFNLDTAEYLELVNGILLISAQANSEHIPFLVGAMALSYPAETYAPVGGMKGLMDFFEEELNRLGVTIKKNTKVISIHSSKVNLQDGQELNFNRLILNLPIWNLPKITEGKLQSEFFKEAEHRPGTWGALTLYFGVKGQFSELYHQIHLNHPMIKNYFVSFSVIGDEKRAPMGHQSVSISTHVLAESCDDKEKDLLKKIIMDDFLQRFKVSDVKFLTIGTPKTFERYTGRKNGFVGGLPFLYGTNPLKMLSPLTKSKDIFRVGDTIFPGQGMCGVVAGALQLHHRLILKR